MINITISDKKELSRSHQATEILGGTTEDMLGLLMNRIRDGRVTVNADVMDAGRLQIPSLSASVALYKITQSGEMVEIEPAGEIACISRTIHVELYPVPGEVNVFRVEAIVDTFMKGTGVVDEKVCLEKIFTSGNTALFGAENDGTMKEEHQVNSKIKVNRDENIIVREAKRRMGMIAVGSDICKAFGFGDFSDPHGDIANVFKQDISASSTSGRLLLGNG